MAIHICVFTALGVVPRNALIAKLASDAFARCRKSTNPLLRGMAEAIDARAEADGISMDVGMEAIDDGVPSLDGDFDF